MVDEASEANVAAESSGGEPAADASTQIVYCARCGGVMGATDRFCHACGWEVGSAEAPRIPAPVINPSDRNRLTALLLCLFLGWFGAHRFYVGKIGTGLIWLFTLGFMGIGVIYDIIFIATGEFRDDRERRVVRWE
jgi:TM2 domain